MNKSKKRSRIKSALFFTYVIISVIVFVLILSWSAKKHKNLESQISENKELLESSNDEREMLKTVQLADDYFFKGDYAQAKISYQSILNTYKLSITQENRIKQKIKRIEDFENSTEVLSDEIRAYQFTLNNKLQKIDSLQSAVSELQSGNEKTVTSKEDEIADLKEKLKQKEKALSRKEDVQVISFKNDKDDVIHYLGEVDNKKANGGGIGIWQTGGIYKGDWEDNKRHGKGEYEWSDGHRYKGEFKNDTRQGEGTYYWPSGEKYEGEWSDGKRNGKGTLYDKDGNVQYDGEWKNDKVAEK